MTMKSKPVEARIVCARIVFEAASWAEQNQPQARRRHSFAVDIWDNSLFHLGSSLWKRSDATSLLPGLAGWWEGHHESAALLQNSVTGVSLAPCERLAKVRIVFRLDGCT